LPPFARHAPRDHVDVLRSLRTGGVVFTGTSIAVRGRVKLSVGDVAKMLNVAEGDVYRWIREGTIPVHRVSDHYRFHRAELLEWATSRGMSVSPEEFHTPTKDGESMPRFSDSLERGGVHAGVRGGDRESVLHAIVELLPIEDDDRDLLYDFLVAREALGSTGIGDGIAIPHVRNPVVLHVAHPSITLCYLEKPVDFAAIDKKPVSTVFLLVSRTIRSHLYLLSRLAVALHDPRFKAAVLRRAPKDELLAEARRIEAGGSAP
jgi:nitrogen PTS system EIIA component